MKTASSMSIFFLAMVLHPEYQTKAQEEIDRVIGTERLPELSDRSSLPFLEYILQESLRWYHAAPTGMFMKRFHYFHADKFSLQGVPHRSLEDDIYNGMFIPKGSVVIANIR